jgi:hypothetical protein
MLLSLVGKGINEDLKEFLTLSKHVGEPLRQKADFYRSKKKES